MQETRSTIQLVGVAAALAMLAALVVANFVADGENGGRAEFAVTAIPCLAIAAALFWWYVPRAARPAVAGLVVAALALLSLPVYWSGLPFVLGPAAAVLGWRELRGGGAAARIAVGAGALAFVLGVVGVIVDAAA